MVEVMVGAVGAEAVWVADARTSAKAVVMAAARTKVGRGQRGRGWRRGWPGARVESGRASPPAIDSSSEASSDGKGERAIQIIEESLGGARKMLGREGQGELSCLCVWRG